MESSHINNLENENKDLSLTQENIKDWRGHRHSYEEKENYLICSCGKRALNLKKTEQDNLLIGIKKNGCSYSVRSDRRRYFFPAEWKKFIDSFNNEKHYFLFLTLLHTGARIMEVCNLQRKNFDFNRGTLTFQVVKQRKAKKNFFAIGKSRTFFVSDKYMKEAKAYIIKNKIAEDDYLFLDKKDLPLNYDELSNKEKKKYYKKTCTAYSQLMKRKLKALKFKDWYNFSLHNIRKTYGNWMRIYDIKTEELCYRLGHDFNTYLMHYGSAMIFTPQEKLEIFNIMGNVK